MKTIEQQIEAIGWTLESVQRRWIDPEPITYHRAVMGGFVTPWRETREDVLKDLQEQAKIEKALDKAEAKLAD